MLRIIDMREATSSGNSFAVWNTVSDRFLLINGEQSFDGELDFCVNAEYHAKRRGRPVVDVERVLGLLPFWAKDQSSFRVHAEFTASEPRDKYKPEGT